jgi:predicted transglutaminase-like protease
VGGVGEIHDRERKLIRELAKAYLAKLRNEDGATQLDPPDEIEWGKVVFRVRLRRAEVRVTLQIEP